jgi:hypothetical protein
MNRQVEVNGQPQMLTEQVKIKGITVRQPIKRETDFKSRLLRFESEQIQDQLRGQGTPVLEQMMADDPELAAVMKSEMATVSLKGLIADWHVQVGIPQWNVRVTITDPEFDTEWELMS